MPDNATELANDFSKEYGLDDNRRKQLEDFADFLISHPWWITSSDGIRGNVRAMAEIFVEKPRSHGDQNG